ncbi:MAG: alpha/beta fold hydrolase [Acidimicrobiales bacterium]
MPYADVNGLSMYYELHGDGEPFVLVMGLAADISEYTFLVMRSRPDSKCSPSTIGASAERTSRTCRIRFR